MKYIVCNLKSHLNEENIKDYINEISKIDYDNLIVLPSKEYISSFKKINCKVGMQDYFDDITCDYVMINHHESKSKLEQVNSKIKSSIDKKMKVILCIGNNDLDDLKSLKNQLDMFLEDIKRASNIIIAYEPYFMIGSNYEVDLKKIEKCISYVKKYFNNNIKVLYGGNVNEENISKILEISDGILVARLSYNPHKFTNTINKLIKNI